MIRAHMEPMRQAAIRAGFSGIAASGVDRWFRSISAGIGVVLTFHRVRPRSPNVFVPNSALEVTPEFLVEAIEEIAQAGYDVISMDDVVTRLRARPGTRPFAVLTFDDGYRDNLDVAMPILWRKGLPWTIFVVEDYLGGKGRLWWIELEKAIASLDRIETNVGARIVQIAARSLAQKKAAFRSMRILLHAAAEMDRNRCLDGLCAEAGLDCAGTVSANCAGWAEIEAVARSSDITIGSHTLHHSALARCADPAAASEIGESKSIMEARLEREVKHIAFPHGDVASAGQRESALAAACGYETAWTTRPGHLFTADSAMTHALPRVSMNGDYVNRSMVRAVLSGVPFLAAARTPGS